MVPWTYLVGLMPGPDCALAFQIFQKTVSVFKCREIHVLNAGNSVE